MAGAPSDPLAGGGGVSAPPPVAVAGSIAQGADFSPPSGGRSGKGGGQVAPAGATKTIQSYFYKPSNSSAVQNLAASYGTGELAGQTRAASGLPQEVDLSGADGDNDRGEPSLAQPMAKIGRSGSTGTVGGGGAGDGGSLQHRFSHAVSSGDQGVSQAQQGHRQVQSRAQGVSLSGGGVGSADGEQAGSEQETVEKLHERLRGAKALEAQLRKDLARANLERGSMETMVGRAPYLAEKPAWFLLVAPIIFWHQACFRLLYVRRTRRRRILCTPQTETLRNQLDRMMEEFKTKETERDAQKKQLTSVVEDLLRKVQATWKRGASLMLRAR